MGLGRGEIAVLGDRAPIRAIVLLDRKSATGEPPQLEALPRSEGLAKLVERGFSLDAGAGEVLWRLTRVAGNAECFRLTYGAAGKAAEYLRNRFSSSGGRSKQL